MTILEISEIDLSSVATQYGILGILAVLLGYFAWNTYSKISRKNDEDYQRLIEKNRELEEEVAALREEMMSLIVEERNRMADLVKANTEALTELRRTITDYMLRA
jgi:F0F1-type ATP synthase membrane subunit b/b'